MASITKTKSISSIILSLLSQFLLDMIPGILGMMLLHYSLGLVNDYFSEKYKEEALVKKRQEYVERKARWEVFIKNVDQTDYELMMKKEKEFCDRELQRAQYKIIRGRGLAY